MAKTQELVFKLGADTRQFAQGMKNIKKTAGSAASELAGVFGVGLGFAGLAAGIGAVVSKLDDIGDRSEQLGVGAEFFQKMEFAAKRSGASMDQVGSAIQKMKVRIGSAAQGDAGPIIAFKKLGLSAKELQAMKPEDAFVKIADALSKVENQNLRAALAQDILGKSANDLMSMFLKLPQLMEEVSQKKIFSQEQIDKARQLADSMEDLKNQFAGAIAETGIIEALSWYTKEVNSALEAMNKAKAFKDAEAKKGKAVTGMYSASKSSFALDFLTLGYGSQWAENLAVKAKGGGSAAMFNVSGATAAEARAANEERRLKLQQEANKKLDTIATKLPRPDSGGADE